MFTQVYPGSTGNGGDLTIKTQKLFVQDGARVSAGTFGAGNSGKLNVTAETIELIGTTPNGQFPSGLFAQAEQYSAEQYSTGNAGDLTINTQKLFVRDGAWVSASTFGRGKGGNLNVTAETIELIGTSLNGQLLSSLFAQAAQGLTGNAGDLTIKTQKLFVRDGAQVGASTFGAGNSGNLNVTAETIELIGTSANGQFRSGLFAQANPGSRGNAGDLTINTQKLFVRDGAKVSASTFGAGNSGKLNVTAETIELIGTTPNGQLPSGLFAQAEQYSTGNAGDLTINTQKLFVRDGAGVFVRSLGTGNAGNLKVTARFIKLDNQGSLTASTSSGDGGNITLSVQDYLFMRRNSNISASGGNNGGNIFINNNPGYRGFVIATPVQNSDITANASTGQGGKVIINSYGIFGFVPRSREDSELRSNGFDPSKLPTNDITAISQQSPTLSGTVEINTLDVDPSQGLLELPDNPTDPSSQIAQNPCQQGAGSSFIITGRGGLPSSPNDGFSSDNVRIDLVNPSTSSSSSQNSTINQPTTQPTAKKIIPAQGWIFNDKGEVVLTAYDPTTTTAQRTSKPTAACPAPF